MSNARLARMCDDTVYARSHDHNRTAVTVFAASHNGSETRLWYALDDLSNGLMQGFRGTAIHDERERETTTPPEVRWCGHAASVQAYGCPGLHRGRIRAGLRYVASALRGQLGAPSLPIQSNAENQVKIPRLQP